MVTPKLVFEEGRCIPLTQGKTAIIDPEDYERLSHHTWCACRAYKNKYYAVGSIGGKSKSMHRFIMDAQKGQIIDHKNGNGLDNRRSNLRFCTYSENGANAVYDIPTKKSKYRGVRSTINRGRRRWSARIGWQGKDMYISYHQTEETAAIAYNAKALELYGDLAILNDIAPIRLEQIKQIDKEIAILQARKAKLQALATTKEANHG